MQKPYFTRRNLIVISLSMFYAFTLLFTGICLSGSAESIIAENNPIALLGNSLGFSKIKIEGANGFVCLLLVAIYVVVLVAALIYEIRYAIINKKKLFSWKMLLIYFITLVVCIGLSYGVSLLIQLPLSGDNVKNLSIFLGQSILLSLLIFAVIFSIVGAVLMFIFNIILVDKPFKFFDKKNLPEIEDDDEKENDVTANFDGNINAGNVVPNGDVTTVGQGVRAASCEVAIELDDREKVFPSLSRIDRNYDGYEIERIDTDDLSLEEICVRFRNYLAKEEKLYFDLDTLRIFISGLAASHFSILEGLSGTGKSSLPRYFAKFVNGTVSFLSVQATWRDKSSILGYFNDFSKTYNETDFLIKLYEASYNPDRINLFVLDEMNISRVEYYFADFLSVLEYPSDQWKLRIMNLPYDFIPPVKLEDGYIRIPTNSYFIGTANKDDSTFAIADKVYDRAITIFFDNKNVPFEVKEDEAGVINLSASKLHSLYEEALEIEENKLTDEDKEKFLKICDYIYDTFDVTFGNRILNQMEVLVPTFIACGGKKEVILDFLLSRKVLAKLEGRFEEYVKNGLKHLLDLINKVYGEKEFSQSRRLINNLIRKL